jgi:hypothetical protein
MKRKAANSFFFLFVFCSLGQGGGEERAGAVSSGYE